MQNTFASFFASEMRRQNGKLLQPGEFMLKFFDQLDEGLRAGQFVEPLSGATGPAAAQDVPLPNVSCM